MIFSVQYKIKLGLSHPALEEEGGEILVVLIWFEYEPPRLRLISGFGYYYHDCNQTQPPRLERRRRGNFGR
jgi:hypothetical protein